MITREQALWALDNMDDYARMAGVIALGPMSILRQYIWQSAPVAEQATKEAAEDASPPFGSKRAAALALYRPPFKFRMGYIHDAGGHMVADQDGFGEGSKVFDTIAARVRGWGRIGYMPDAEALQDEVGAVLADALTAYWNSATRAKE